MVKVLKAFLDGDKIVQPGADIQPTHARHLELARNGLVEPPAKGAQAPEPEPEPEQGDAPGVITSKVKPKSRRKLLEDGEDQAGEQIPADPAEDPDE